MELRREYRIMPLKRGEAAPDRLSTWDVVRDEIRVLVPMTSGTKNHALFDQRVTTPATTPLPDQPQLSDRTKAALRPSSRSMSVHDSVDGDFEFVPTAAYNNGRFDISPETRIEALTRGQTWPAGRIHVVTHRIVRGRDGYELEPIDGDHEVSLIQIEPQFRRQGLATRLWQTAERTGLRPNPDLRSPGNFLTPAGAGFLESLRHADRAATDQPGAPDRSAALQAVALRAPAPPEPPRSAAPERTGVGRTPAR